MAITFSLDQNTYLLQMMHFKVHSSYGLHLFIYHVHHIIFPFRMTAHTSPKFDQEYHTLIVAIAFLDYCECLWAWAQPFEPQIYT
jgi:hypothetical protein